MSILLSDLKLCGAATEADDDTVTAVGGAIDKAVKVHFTDVGGSFMVVSSATADTVPTVQVFYRDGAGALQNETQTLTGQAPVNYAATPERFMKGLKSGTTVGDIAVITQTPYFAPTGCSPTGATETTIVLTSDASGVDQAYRGMVIRLLTGTGAGQLREIIDYIGSTKVATVNAAWSVTPVAVTYTISNGYFFEKTPSEVTQVRRPFYGAIANPPGGASKTYYEKFFYRNDHATLDLTSAQILLASNPTGLITLGVEGALDGTTTNGTGNNRLVAPAGISFGAGPLNVPNGQTLTHAKGCPFWAAMTLAGGAAAQKSSFSVQLQGATV
jgi:hypothetical protein